MTYNNVCDIRFIKVHENAKLPKRNYIDMVISHTDSSNGKPVYEQIHGTHDAGYDIFCCKDATIPARQAIEIETGIKVGYITPGFWFRIEARSGLGFKNKLFPHFGIIDNTFRGNMSVLIYNNSDEDYTFKRGERIAQLVIYPLITSTIGWTEESESTQRGEKGWGSSGK